MEYSTGMAAILVRWVMMSETVLLSNSKILAIISLSSSWIVPFSLPTSTIMIISSSVTRSSSSVAFTPRKRVMTLVDNVKNLTNGYVIFDKVVNGLAAIKE